MMDTVINPYSLSIAFFGMGLLAGMLSACGLIWLGIRIAIRVSGRDISFKDHSMALADTAGEPAGREEDED
jgi:hypothetical protein